MSIKQIEQWRQARLTENGAWARDTMDCVLYAMENRQPCSVLHKESLESLYEYKYLVEIGCDFLIKHPNTKDADSLIRTLRNDAKILWRYLGGKMRCNPAYSEHSLRTIGIFFQCLQMAENWHETVTHHYSQHQADGLGLDDI
ncbi:MAG: hypothetical protein U1A25_01595 [Candidatus Sungbacteria bacterium]|nr:hypothetical protein [bacterium]MDZ4260334.1 hypothetical protein [Candidatus Sungbacteria bacterium]